MVHTKKEIGRTALPNVGIRFLLFSEVFCRLIFPLFEAHYLSKDKYAGRPC
jgi:hypothetical protein